MEKAIEIPKEVTRVTSEIRNKGFEAYLVGGCVRDLLLKRKPKDWDVTTNAKPLEIQGIFPHTFYENDFGTVGVVNDDTEETTLKNVEVTTYRVESGYSDARRPDTVSFSTRIEDDLKRRDFTVNAIAFDEAKGQFVDPYGGQADIKDMVLRAVGEPMERFNEDALRMLRAVRLHAELGFIIESKTEKAIVESRDQLKKISRERVRDEFVRILLSEHAIEGLLLAKKLGILGYITPELERGVGVEQNQAHKYDVFEHNMRTLQHAVDKNFGLDLRLASLFHDISKPETRRWSNEKREWTFYGHDVVGGKLVRNILSDLKFPRETVEKVSKLVRWHMFFSDPEKITLSAVRRIIANVGKEDVWELMNLRICDRIGTGRPKENPYRFRKYKAMVEEALHDPVSVQMLEIDGEDIIKILGIEPGPKVGYILHALLEEVLEDPSKNTAENLKETAQNMNKLDFEELKRKGEQGKDTKTKEQEKEIKEIRDKYYVE